MTTFKEYFILTENIISSVPIAELDMTPASTVPPNPVYGFWVDRSGNYKPCTYVGHAKAAAEIIQAAYNAKHTKPPFDVLSDYRSVYETLYDAGFMRVVRSNDIYYYNPQTITSKQQSFLKMVCEEFDMDYRFSVDIF